VEAAVAGDNEVSVGDKAVEVEQVQEVIRARDGAGTEEHGGESHTAGGTRAWGAGVGGGSVVPRASECVDQVVESCIESGHLGRVGTFLRAEYCCCPGESE